MKTYNNQQLHSLLCSLKKCLHLSNGTHKQEYSKKSKWYKFVCENEPDVAISIHVNEFKNTMLWGKRSHSHKNTQGITTSFIYILKKKNSLFQVLEHKRSLESLKINFYRKK